MKLTYLNAFDFRGPLNTSYEIKGFGFNLWAELNLAIKRKKAQKKKNKIYTIRADTSKTKTKYVFSGGHCIFTSQGFLLCFSNYFHFSFIRHAFIIWTARK